LPLNVAELSANSSPSLYPLPLFLNKSNISHAFFSSILLRLSFISPILQAPVYVSNIHFSIKKESFINLSYVFVTSVLQSM